MKNIDHDLRYINIGCGSHPIQDWINYDYNKFIFFARIKILRYILNKLSFIPEGYKQFMYKVIKEKPLTLAHIPYGDAYQIPYAHIRGLTYADLAQQRKWTKMWNNLSQDKVAK